MAAPKRTKQQILHDRQTIAGLYLEGHTQTAIAEKLGLTRTLVQFDLRQVYRQWTDSALFDFDAARARELAKLDRIEAELWERHWASLEDRTISTAKKVDGKEARSESGRRIESTSGDPRWLTLILQCVAQRARILGLERTEPVATGVRVLVVHPEQLEAEEWADQFGGQVLEPAQAHLPEERSLGRCVPSNDPFLLAPSAP